jgi:hypothetical protein
MGEQGAESNHHYQFFWLAHGETCWWAAPLCRVLRREQRWMRDRHLARAGQASLMSRVEIGKAETGNWES